MQIHFQASSNWRGDSVVAAQETTRPTEGEEEFFPTRLDQIFNIYQEQVRLGDKIDWLDRWEIVLLYSDKGRPGIRKLVRHRAIAASAVYTRSLRALRPRSYV